MSSEETGSESGSGSEMTTKVKIFLTKPVPWRSPEASTIMDSLDRKIARRRSDRAKEMCRTRRTGLPSTRLMPDDLPSDVSSWAVNDLDN